MKKTTDKKSEAVQFQSFGQQLTAHLCQKQSFYCNRLPTRKVFGANFGITKGKSGPWFDSLTQDSGYNSQTLDVLSHQLQKKKKYINGKTH